MTRITDAARKAARMLLPWPSRHERRRDIASAKAEKQHSRARAAHAAEVEQQIRRIAEANHFAEVIADQLMGRGQP